MFKMRLSSHNLEIKRFMSQSSHIVPENAQVEASKDPERRHPQRARGKERVAQLLQAGAEIFAEKGFDAATMTEIAARAGASIGSLYQFFPNKDLLGDSLHAANLDEIASLLDQLVDGAAVQTAGEVAEAILTQLGDFLLEHPEFAVLSERRSVNAEKKIQVRHLMREKITHLLQLSSSAIPKENAETFAVIILHLMKVLVAIYQEPDLANRDSVLQSLRAMLRQSL